MLSKKDATITTPVSASLIQGATLQLLNGTRIGLPHSYSRNRRRPPAPRTRAPLAAAIDVQRLVRHSEGHSASLARVKVKVRSQSCRKVVDSTALEDFLSGLKSDGFIQMGQEGKLVLRLLLSPLQVLEESLVGIQRQSFEQAANTPLLEVTEASVERERVVLLVLVEASLGNEASEHTVQSEPPSQGDAPVDVEEVSYVVEAHL